LFRALNQLRYGGAGVAFSQSFAMQPPWLPDPPRMDRRMPVREEISAPPMTPTLLPMKFRQSLPWQLELAQFLRDLAQWKPEQEATESDFFHQKCRIYNSLIEITPQCDLYDRVLSEYRAFLSLNRFNRESFTDWFLHVTDAVRRSRTIGKEESGRLIEALRTADDPVLRLYVKLLPYFDIASRTLGRREANSEGKTQ
jgi:hypothetical protein